MADKDDILVFDLETKKSFDEVGGKNNLELLGISVLGAYSYNQNKFLVFEENELSKFEELLKKAKLVVGFNIRDFDLPVLRPYVSSLDLNSLKILDLMDDVVKGVGFRLSLNNLVQASLEDKKSADGLQALEWFKEGRIQEVKDYCIQDVRITRDLYEYGRKNGHILFISRETRQKVAVPVLWSLEPKPNITEVLRDAFEKRKSVEIEYVTKNFATGADNSGPNNTRLVDIYKFNSNSFEGYCHLRKAKRNFKIDRVLSASLTKHSYKLDDDVQDVLI